MFKAGFIGCGHMGGALAGAAARAVGGSEVLTSDRDAGKVSALRNDFGTVPAETLRTASESRYLFLGVKPQGMKETAEEIRDAFLARTDSPILVSMAAGISLASLSGYFPGAKIIRILPNLPVSTGEGVILYTPGKNVTEEDEAGFRGLMKEAGFCLRIDENKIDAGCALIGCGPAFICLWMEAMIAAGIRSGLSSDMAREMTVRTFLGTASLLKESGEDPAALRQAVCSPAGSTIEGVAALEKSGARAGAMDAVDAAFRRTVELGKS